MDLSTRCLAQAYGLTWDPELRAIVQASVDLFADPEGDIGLTKDRPYHSSTYKTQSDVGALLDMWEILGQPRLREIALEVSQYLWADLLGKTPLGYNNPVGRIGPLLHEETQDPSVPEVLAQQLRWFARLYDRQKREFRSTITRKQDREALTWRLANEGCI